MSVVADACSVFKLRIGLAIALSAVAGLAVTPGPAVSGWKVAALGAAVLLASASAGAFNQYYERDLDARMARTRRRPFVTGAFAPGAAWLAAIALLLAIAVAGAGIVLGTPAAAFVFLGAFVYGFVYTVWLKRRTAWNIVIGGLSGSFAVLAGAATTGPWLELAPLALALAIFLWTPPHFWSLAMAVRDDYAAAGVPMLPVVVGDRRAGRIILAHTVLLVAVSLVPAAAGLGAIYLACAALGGAVFLWRSFQLARQPGPGAARANFAASLLQLGLLLAGAMADGWVG
jgi:protoheme IX farnesyltransferase